MPEVLAYEAPPPRSRKWLFYCLLAVALWGVIQLGIFPAPLFDLAQSAVLPLLR